MVKSKKSEYEEINGIRASKNLSKEKKQHIKTAPKNDPDCPVSDADLEPGNQKVLISIRLDGDIIEAAREKAGSRGYQTLINEILRRELIYNETFRIVLSNFQTRIENLEKKVAKKA